MAALTANQLTLADVAARTVDGKIDPMAMLLSQDNEVVMDIPLREANQMTTHIVTINTGLPTAYFRSYNQGVPLSKATSVKVEEPMAMLEQRSHIDAKLMKLNGNSAELRLSEERPAIESMSQKMVGTIFNGNHGVDPLSFSGAAIRTSSTTAGNGTNVIKAGGSGSDNASIYLINWSTDTIFGVYPKGSNAGLQMTDLGEESVQDSSGNYYQAMRTLYQWDMGLVVRDWRNLVRICNIDISDWLGTTGTQALTADTNVVKLMVKAIARLPSNTMGKKVFYTNRSIKEGLMIQALDRSQNVLSVEDSITQFGTTIKELRFLGIPIRTVDQLGIAETLVV